MRKKSEAPKGFAFYQAPQAGRLQRGILITR